MKTLIIAEAGVNHNGDIQMAKALIRAAAKAKADCVKFQTFQASDLASPTAPKAVYQMETTNDRQSQYEMLQALELSREDHLELLACCQEEGIEFLSSPFSVKALEMLLEMGISRIKLPSGEITNYPLLVKAAQAGRPIILSTGMATLDEVKEAVATLKAHGMPIGSLTLLQCTTEYPTPFCDVNLLGMRTLAETFGVPAGLSDHTEGIAVATASVALGATVIEKHFTLDKALPGPDHRASLNPQELIDLVTAVRQVEASLGQPAKSVAPAEAKNRIVARKSLHLACDASAGTTITEEHLFVLRPGDGISPMEWPTVVGRTLTTNLPSGHKLRQEDLG